MAAKTGSFIAAMPSLIRSLAVLTVSGEMPAGSANNVFTSPRALARWFIRSTKALSELASQRASVCAKLLADGISMPWSI